MTVRGHLCETPGMKNLKTSLAKSAWNQVEAKWGGAIQHVPTSTLKLCMESSLLYLFNQALEVATDLDEYRGRVRLAMADFAANWPRFEFDHSN